MFAKKMRSGVCILATIGWKVMLNPFWGISCETEMRLILASGQKRVSNKTIRAFCPQILQPNLTVPTLLGWIVLPPIP